MFRHRQTCDLMTDPRIIIVGTGIVGACFAYAAAQRGLRPLVISADAPADGGTATAASWAWINACSTDDPDYFKLRFASLQRWQIWMQQLDGIRFTARETFLWDLPPDELTAAVDGLAGLGYPVELMGGAELAMRLPRLCEIPDAALYSAIEGAVEPTAATSALLAAAGAEQRQTHVQGLISDGTRITGVITEAGPILADEVILAAGNATPRILHTVSVSLDMQSSDGLLVLSEPMEPFLSSVVAGLDFHVRQREDGRLLVGGTFGAYQPRPGNDSLAEDAGDQLLRISEVFDLPSFPKVDRFTMGTRPIPQGGMPCIGRCPRPDGGRYDGLYVAVMHSGFSNGAGVAHAAMTEILDGADSAELAPFRMPGLVEGSA